MSVVLDVPQIAVQNPQPQPISPRRVDILKAGEKIIKANHKDFLRLIETVLRWSAIAFKDLDNLFPVIAFADNLKKGMSVLSLHDFTTGAFKLGSSIKNLRFSEARIAACDEAWNAMKVAKWISQNVQPIAKTFLNKISIIGGACFAASSLEKAYIEAASYLRLDNTHHYKKMLHLNKTINNITKAMIGALVGLGAFFAFATPGIAMLILATTMLATNIITAILKESCLNH